jgi:hypothetical protein
LPGGNIYYYNVSEWMYKWIGYNRDNKYKQ